MGMAQNIKVRLIPLFIFVLSAIYYIVLSAKQFTWVFVSGDSGDWLAASTWWMVPQPLGSPLYIALGHFLNIFPGDLVIKMTVALSCIPAAATVALVYCIVNKLTARRGVAAISAAATLGAATMLSQSTVIEEYALTTMFITAALWFYVNERRSLTALCLGLGTAVSAVVLPIAAPWFFFERRQWREYIRPAAVYAISGIGPYVLILVLMATQAAPVLSDGLSAGGIYNYITGTSGSIVGNIALVDMPKRILWTAALLFMNMGLCLVPLLFVRKPLGRLKLPIIVAVFFVLYYLTCLDPVTWTFLTMAVPALAIAAGVGLSRMQPAHARAVAVGAIALIIANCIWMNANVIAKSDGAATAFVEEMRIEVPNGSVVLCYGGRFSLATFYLMAQGADITPIVNQRADFGDWPDYNDWLEGRGLSGNTTAALVDNALAQGRRVFVIGTQWGQTENIIDHWEDIIVCCKFKEGEIGFVRELGGFSLLQPAQLSGLTTPSGK